MAPVNRKSRRGAQGQGQGQSQGQMPSRERLRSRWSDSTTSGSGSGTSSRGSSKEHSGGSPTMQLEAARALVMDLVNLPSPTRTTGPVWAENEAAQSRLYNGRPSYREQLRATGNQALQRVKEGTKAPMMQRTDTPETATPKSLPLSSPPTSPMSMQMSPQMQVQSDSGSAPGSPMVHSRPAPYLSMMNSAPTSPMMGWHDYSATGLQMPDAAGFWALGSPMMDMRREQHPIDFMTMTLMQAGAFGVDKEQLAAQLRAAADVLYED